MNFDWEEEFEERYDEGFADGFAAAKEKFQGRNARKRTPRSEKRSPKKKRRQSPKQKLLKTMTDAKWKKYKRGNGKKTWVQIRAEVSRSQLYKKKARRL